MEHYFNDFIHSLPVVSAYADYCTLSHSYAIEESANAVEVINRQLDDITASARRWQVKFFAKKKVISISRLRDDRRLLEYQLRFGEDTLATKISINILGVEVDSKANPTSQQECGAQSVPTGDTPALDKTPTRR